MIIYSHFATLSSGDWSKHIGANSVKLRSRRDGISQLQWNGRLEAFQWNFHWKAFNLPMEGSLGRLSKWSHIHIRHISQLWWWWRLWLKIMPNVYNNDIRFTYMKVFLCYFIFFRIFSLCWSIITHPLRQESSKEGWGPEQSFAMMRFTIVSCLPSPKTITAL